MTTPALARVVATTPKLKFSTGPRRISPHRQLLTLDALKAYAVARTLFAPTTLERAIHKLGFVQADPIRAPARAQDLTLRHRVADYRVGRLDARYPQLAVEEDFFVNYGYLPRATRDLMHPRTPQRVWSNATWKRAQSVLDLVRERGAVHPREVEAELQQGKAKNWFGGSSNAATLLLDGLHYRGLVRTVRRDGGVRVYGPAPDIAPSDPVATLDRLIDVVVNLYAPLPEPSLRKVASYLGGGVPQWRHYRSALLARTVRRLPSATVAGVRWFWPAGENPGAARWRAAAMQDRVRFLAPFDPLVWDRTRFELLWGWAYRFEAYTPAAKRVRGYYAMPVLWRDHVVGWGNLSTTDTHLVTHLGYADGVGPQDPAYATALTADLDHMARFLRWGGGQKRPND